MRLDMNNHRTLSAISAPNKLHGALESSFPEAAEKFVRLIVEAGRNYLLILSSEKRTSAGWQRSLHQWEKPGKQDYTPLLDLNLSGQSLAILPCANPIHSVPAGPGQRGRGCAHSTPQNQIEWAKTKLRNMDYPVGRRIRHNKIGLVSLQKRVQRGKRYLFGGDL